HSLVAWAGGTDANCSRRGFPAVPTSPWRMRFRGPIGRDSAMIEITEVRVSLRNDEKLKAFVSITLNNAFVIRGLKIIRGNTGLFVARPSRKRPDGQHQDLAHPINDTTRKYLTQIVLDEYEREMVRPPHLRQVHVSGDSQAGAE